MRPLWKPKDIQLCLEVENQEERPTLADYWRVNRRRTRRFLRDRQQLQRPRFFCQNSGACGSTYLVQLLRDNAVERCFHEKRPDMNALGVRHYDRPCDRQRLKSLMRYTRWDVFFEANNRLFSLSSALSDAFPGCRFLHLFRDGRQAVASALSKPGLPQYLATNIRFRGTLAGSADQSPLVRFCHYWNNINRRLLEDLDQLIERHGAPLYLSLDDLKQGRLARLEAFLGLELPIKTRPVVNRGRVGNQGICPEFDSWSAAQQRTFWDICGATQQELQRRHAAGAATDQVTPPGEPIANTGLDSRVSA